MLSDQPGHLEEADETSQAAWKRLRLTELPGKVMVQHVEMHACCAVNSRFPGSLACHTCYGGHFVMSLSHICSYK